MADELAGKVAIVTGGSRGLGRGIVELFVEEGARVVIADVREDEGQDVARAMGDAVRFKRTDVSRRDEVQALVDFVVSEFGQLDAMVNNAGLSDNSYMRLIDEDFASFDKVVRVNMLGLMLCTQIAARQMRAQGTGGSVINTSSIAAVRPGFGLFTYRASKAGVINFTKVAAVELGEYAVRVNCICPGNIPTEMGTFAAAPGEAPAKGIAIREAVNEVRMRTQALKREGTPRDIAEATLFFASDRSKYVTGQYLSIDAGITAGDTVSLIGEIMNARAKAEAAFG